MSPQAPVAAAGDPIRDRHARRDRIHGARPARAFHGWRIVAVLAVTETVSWGVLYYAFAVFQVPMGAELGLTPAQLSGAFSVAVLLTGLAAVPVGWWVDARGPRGLMTAGAAVSAALVAAWSQVHSLVGLYLVMGGIGLARAAVLYDPAFAVIVRWFRNRRSAALLAVTLVAGFASTVALPASNALVEAFGWRDALLVLAGVLAAVTVAPHWLVLRRDPADLGLHPDGADAPPLPHHADAAATGWSDDGGPGRLRATVRWAAGQTVFRWYAAAFASQATAVIIVAFHLVPFLREQGHSAAFAATATGALGALSVCGRLVVTGAARRLPIAAVAAGTFALQGAGVVVLLVAGSSPAGAVGFVVLFGIGFGVGTIARPALLAHSFGVARYATLGGLTALITTLTTTAGPFAAGLTRTGTGSYTPALVGVLALCLAAAVCVLRAGSTSVAVPVSDQLLRAKATAPRHGL